MAYILHHFAWTMSHRVVASEHCSGVAGQHAIWLCALQVKVLRSMKEIKLEDVVIGQYRNRDTQGASYPGYLDDDTVPPNR